MNGNHRVYKARLKGSLQWCALKEFHKDDLKTMLREMRLLRTLNHPYVASIDFVFRHKMNVYMHMEFYERGTLQSLMAKSPDELSVVHKRALVRQLFTGINYLHGRRIIHCDLKPENIFLTGQAPALLKIGDFDVSKDIAGRTHQARTIATSVKGFTAFYAAPEVLLRGQSATFASDVYSAGLIMLDLYFPTIRLKAAFVANLHADIKVPKLSSEPSLQPLLRSILHSDPTKRPSAAQVLFPF
jgi:serine/threonine protein kinase